MPTPENNANYVYRMRVGSGNAHEGLFVISAAFTKGAFDGSANETWQLSGNKLMNRQTSTYIGGTTGKATLTTSASATVLTFPTGAVSGTNYVKGANNYYLNWTSNALTWETTAKTSWRFERLIKFTGIPSMSTDYFSEKCGNTTGGTWPANWSTKVRELYKKVFSTTTCTDSKAFVNLYGAMYNNAVSPSSYRGKFHTGIDMNFSDQRAIYAPIIGAKITAVKANASDFGVVTIECSPGVNFLFAHMVIDITKIKVGELTKADVPLGKQSNVGLSGGASHLHFEVTTSTSISPLNSGSWETIGSTKSPYSYL